MKRQPLPSVNLRSRLPPASRRACCCAMLSCRCEQLPCGTCASCPVCQCACTSGPRPAAVTPSAKRRRGGASLPDPPFLVPSPPPQPPPHLLNALPPLPLPLPLPSTSSPALPVGPVPVTRGTAPSCIVSTNVPAPPDRYLHQREQLHAVLPLLELDASAALSLPAVRPGLKFDATAHRAALHLMHGIVHAVARLVFPTDPDGLAAHCISADPAAAPPSVHELLARNVVAAMKATRRGTLARRYIRSVLCGTLPRAEVNHLLGYPAEEDHDHIENESVITSGPNVVSHRATCATSLPGHPIADDEDEGEDGNENGHAGTDKFPRMSSKTFSRSRRDWDTLIEHGELQAPKFGRARVQDEALYELLKFLFSAANVLVMSWTRQRIIAHRLRLDLPALVGAKKGGFLHEAYSKLLQRSGKKPLSRGSFYAVAKTLTRREISQVFPVDNVTQALVKDPLTLLRDLVMRVIVYPHRTNFLKNIDMVEWFLIHSYVESHIGKDTTASHDLNFALRSDALMSTPTAMFDRPVQCRGFESPFALLDQINDVAKLAVGSADAEILSKCRERFLCYLGLLCCKTAQDRAIETALNEIVARKLRNRVVIFMSHLSKSDAARAAKAHLTPNLDHVTMYGSVVYYLGKENPAGSLPQGLEALLYNHVVCNDTQNDVRVVAFVMEALLHRIREDVECANEVIFVSDNSPSYKNHILPSLLPHLARSSGFQALRYIYSCSQICEFIRDAQLEVVMRFVRDDFVEGEVSTPQSVVQTVNGQHNLVNMAAELIVLADEYQAFGSDLQNDASAFPSMGDKNDIEYKEWKVVGPAATGHSASLSVLARLYDFSGIGKGQPFEIKDSSLKELKKVVAHRERENRHVPSGDLAWIGPVTGVRVATGARSLHLSGQSNLQLHDGVTEGVVADTVTQLRSVARPRLESEKWSASEPELTSTVNKSVAGPTCSGCKRSFKSESFLKSHTCKGPPLEKDVSARAIVVACEMLRCGELPIFRNPSEHLEFTPAVSPSLTKYSIKSLWFGWARQPFGWGRAGPMAEDMMETSFTLEYKKEVFAILDKEKDQHKINAKDLQELLRSRHLGNGDIPSEIRVHHWCQLYEAGKRIQPYYMIGPDGTPLVSYDEESQGVGSGRSRMNPLYVKKITDMHKQDLALPELRRPKPRNMYKEFVNFFKDAQGRLPPDFPDQKQVMNKINALRTKSRQQ